jgi:hypothetical protein
MGLAALSRRADAQQGDTTWIKLPTANPANAEAANFAAQDLEMLDVTIGGDWARFFYTTNGAQIKNTLQVWELQPGRLRPIDVRIPLPDLVNSAPGSQWPQGPVGSEDWMIRAHIPNWNQVLDPLLPPRGKGSSLVGLVSHNGFLTVAGTRRNDLIPNPPGPPADPTVPEVKPWNGLTLLDGVSMTFDPANNIGKELWSAGTTEGVRAVPEGNLVFVTTPRNWTTSTVLLQANYCGADYGGTLLVQEYDNLPNVDPAKRLIVDMYALLGAYTDSLPQPAGSLGDEVTPSTTWFNKGVGDREGNKIRPLVLVKVKNDPGYPNKNRKLLFVGLNLDPVDITSYDTDPTTSPPAPANVRLDDAGSSYSSYDDGKYDYLAVIDVTNAITGLAVPLPNPDDLWLIRSQAEWASRIRFLRLPPNLPYGFDLAHWNQQQQVPDDSGYDWSYVTVQKPGDASTTHSERLVGAGTVKTMVADPEGRFLYVITSDQGQEGIAEQDINLIDGGWHVPHLFVIDLAAGDFTNQAFLNGYKPTRYRFNKLIESQGPPSALWTTGAAAFPLFGATNITSDIPEMPPHTQLYGGASRVSATRYSNPQATLTQVGGNYPGENQLDPTARAKARTVHNAALPDNPTRLYACTIGKTQQSMAAHIPGDQQPYNAKYGTLVGAVLELSISTTNYGYGIHVYLNTLIIPKINSGFEIYQNPYQVAGFSVVPPFSPYHRPDELDRNVLVITALNTIKLTSTFPSPTPQDLLVFIEQDR